MSSTRTSTRTHTYMVYGIVLDPFIGSGTVAVVAQQHNRNYLGIELNPDYVKTAEERILNTKVRSEELTMLPTKLIMSLIRWLRK